MRRNFKYRIMRRRVLSVVFSLLALGLLFMFVKGLTDVIIEMAAVRIKVLWTAGAAALVAFGAGFACCTIQMFNKDVSVEDMGDIELTAVIGAYQDELESRKNSTKKAGQKP